MQITNRKMNFLGDSITEGVGTSAPEKRYVDIIAAKTGSLCRNYGISGTRIARQRRPTVDNPSFDLDFCRRAEEMDEDADIVVVFGGTNDFGHGDAPFGVMADRTTDTFCGAMHVLCRTLLTRYPRSEIVFILPPHRLNENEPRGDNKPAPVAVLKDYVNAMREILEYYSIPALDLYAKGRMQPAVPVSLETYMPDGLHPNDAGNALIAERLMNFLQAL